MCKATCLQLKRSWTFESLDSNKRDFIPLISCHLVEQRHAQQMEKWKKAIVFESVPDNLIQFVDFVNSVVYFSQTFPKAKPCFCASDPTKTLPGFVRSFRIDCLKSAIIDFITKVRYEEDSLRNWSLRMHWSIWHRTLFCDSTELCWDLRSQDQTSYKMWSCDNYDDIVICLVSTTMFASPGNWRKVCRSSNIWHCQVLQWLCPAPTQGKNTGHPRTSGCGYRDFTHDESRHNFLDAIQIWYQNIR